MPKSTTNKPRNKNKQANAPVKGEVLPEHHLEDSATAMFLKEVDDAIHEENLKNFWNTWKYAILGGVAAIFVLSLGYQYYNQVQMENRAAAAEEWMRLSTVENLTAEDIAQVEAMGVAGPTVLAEFDYASQLLAAGKAEEAVAAYDAVAETASLPQIVRQLAKLYAGIAAMHVDMSTAETRFSAQDMEENPFRASVWVFMAEISEQKGENAAALALWEKLAALPTAPQTLRQQAEKRALRLQAMAVKTS